MFPYIMNTCVILYSIILMNRSNSNIVPLIIIADYNYVAAVCGLKIVYELKYFPTHNIKLFITIEYFRLVQNNKYRKVKNVKKRLTYFR